MSPHAERQPDELLAYLRLLADGARPAQFFDLRYRPPAGLMRRRFVSVLRPDQLAQQVAVLAPRADVYLGAALRDRAAGDRTAISGAHLLYIESDDPHAGRRLAGFACPPAMVIASGTPGHLHIYWRLRHRASVAQIESANRRLALALHGEPGCADIVRLLRPPGSLNHKHTPPRPVRLLRHDPAMRYALADVLAALPDDAEPIRKPVTPTRPRRLTRTALDRQLLAIPAADYVRTLTGRQPDRAGKVLCPFHQETVPSLQTYSDGTFYCFGAHCHKGGTIFDFAAALWGTGTRHNDFLALRRRLAATFAIARPHGER